MAINAGTGEPPDPANRRQAIQLAADRRGGAAHDLSLRRTKGRFASRRAIFSFNKSRSISAAPSRAFSRSLSSASPVVGWVEPPFELKPDPIEVADVFEVPLAFLLDRENQKRHFRMIGELRRDYFAIPYGARYIWGATAAMLMMLDRTLRDD